MSCREDGKAVTTLPFRRIGFAHTGGIGLFGAASGSG